MVSLTKRRKDECQHVTTDDVWVRAAKHYSQPFCSAASVDTTEHLSSFPQRCSTSSLHVSIFSGGSQIRQQYSTTRNAPLTTPCLASTRRLVCCNTAWLRLLLSPPQFHSYHRGYSGILYLCIWGISLSPINQKKLTLNFLALFSRDIARSSYANFRG